MASGEATRHAEYVELFVELSLIGEKEMRNSIRLFQRDKGCEGEWSYLTNILLHDLFHGHCDLLGHNLLNLDLYLLVHNFLLKPTSSSSILGFCKKEEASANETF